MNTAHKPTWNRNPELDPDPESYELGNVLEQARVNMRFPLWLKLAIGAFLCWWAAELFASVLQGLAEWGVGQ